MGWLSRGLLACTATKLKSHGSKPCVYIDICYIYICNNILYIACTIYIYIYTYIPRLALDWICAGLAPGQQQSPSEGAVANHVNQRWAETGKQSSHLVVKLFQTSTVESQKIIECRFRFRSCRHTLKPQSFGTPDPSECSSSNRKCTIRS